ncbi:MAG: hypothetical protein Q8K82_20180, partial [Gemmatimonadaceae bacterium]|nr:hypothetical protein [Gemmatimonadaceae bacterium]
KSVAGSIRFIIEDGMCVGEMEIGNVFGDFLNGFLQKDAKALRIIGLDAQGGLSRAALVTPIGIFDLRAQRDGTYFTRLTPTRTVAFALFTN